MRGAKILCLVLAGGLLASSAPAQLPCGPDPAVLREVNRALSDRAVKIELWGGELRSRVLEVEVGAESVVGRTRRGERLEIPIAQVRRIETLAKRHPLARFLRGLAIGVGVGATVYLTSRNGVLNAKSSVIGAGGAIGGGIGGIVGLAAPALDGELICERATPPPAAP